MMLTLRMGTPALLLLQGFVLTQKLEAVSLAFFCGVWWEFCLFVLIFLFLFLFLFLLLLLF